MFQHYCIIIFSFTGMVHVKESSICLRNRVEGRSNTLRTQFWAREISIKYTGEFSLSLSHPLET
jgi:hypothetical protein